MKQLEPFWYETAPYLYSVAGMAAVLSMSYWGILFGMLLITLSAYIMGMRKIYRKIGRKPLRGDSKLRRNLPQKPTESAFSSAIVRQANLSANRQPEAPLSIFNKNSQLDGIEVRELNGPNLRR
jgi:hypothetical protein